MKKAQLTLSFLLCLLVSCKSVQITKSIDCGAFNVNIENNSVNDLYFANRLKNKISEKIVILQNQQSKNICKINISYKRTEKDTLISSSGTTTDKNIKYNVKITFNDNKNSKKVKEKIIFYNTNVSDYKYSEKVKNEKEEQNVVEKISNEVIFTVLKYGK